jgi:hypothetical protein
MERLFRSLKTEWVPTVGYMTAALAEQDIGRYLMQCYNWTRPHQHNGLVPPAVVEEKLKSLSGNCLPLQPSPAPLPRFAVESALSSRQRICSIPSPRPLY